MSKTPEQPKSAKESYREQMSRTDSLLDRFTKAVKEKADSLGPRQQNCSKQEDFSYYGKLAASGHK